jgi:hypothetical protein
MMLRIVIAVHSHWVPYVVDRPQRQHAHAGDERDGDALQNDGHDIDLPDPGW